MDELIIQKHNFELAKNKIQEYANSSPRNVILPRVKEDGGFLNWGDHKVTGTELNKCMSQVQTSLISLNDASKAIISEFKEVYNAFEALDKDYIGGIILSVNAAKQASDDAKKASNEIALTIEALKRVVNKVGIFQKKIRDEITVIKANSNLATSCPNDLEEVDLFNEIDKTYLQEQIDLKDRLANLEHTTSIISQFKDNIAKIQHIIDVDVLWDDFKSHSKSFNNFLNDYEKYTSEVTKYYNIIQSDISELKKHWAALEQLDHLNDIDDLWNKSVKNETAIIQLREVIDSSNKAISDSINTITYNISELQDYKSILSSYIHLPHIDQLWNDFQTLSGLVDNLSMKVTQQATSISKLEFRIIETNEQMEEKNAFMSRKLRILQVTTGCSIFIIATTLILIILGII